MKIKVMVVEDNIPLKKTIVNMLVKENYLAFSESEMDEAKEMFLQERPDIVLLDIMLPQGYGHELIAFFKKHHKSWVIMLTALGDEGSKRICYENGADDYITKPFDLYELTYKLNAIRRRILANSKELQIGDIKFNLETNKITCKEKTIAIQPSQIRFLKLMYDRYLDRTYVHKLEALEETSGEVDEAKRLQTLVARLRKNLSYIGSEQIDIETIYGQGYQIRVNSDRDDNE